MSCKEKYNGWLFLDKPLGISSNKVLQCVRKIFKNQKAGYVGTLDPFATGVLPIAIGNATKTISLVNSCTKGYIFSILWGQKTTTGDLEGKVVRECSFFPQKRVIESKLECFKGEIFQTPHRYSSKKIHGIRAYKLARKNIEFSLGEKKISIFDFRLLKILSSNSAEFFVKCSSGTYVRSLSEDLASSLNTLATVSSLRRVEFSNFNKKLISLDYLISLMHSEELINVIEPINSLFGEMKEINFGREQASLILNGCFVKTNCEFARENEPVFAKCSNNVIAFGYLLNKIFYPKKILNTI